MKRIATYLMGFSLLAITTVSCSKEGHEETRQQAQAAPQVINATVPAGDTYVLNLGTGSSARIKVQALHHQFSEIATAPNGSTVYKYTAAKGFSGADEVTLQQTVTSIVQGGGGCYGNYSDNHTTTTVKTIAIKFNIAN
jgi:hypothetical protein